MSNNIAASFAFFRLNCKYTIFNVPAYCWRFTLPDRCPAVKTFPVKKKFPPLFCSFFDNVLGNCCEKVEIEKMKSKNKIELCFISQLFFKMALNDYYL